MKTLKLTGVLSLILFQVFLPFQLQAQTSPRNYTFGDDEKDSQRFGTDSRKEKPSGIPLLNVIKDVMDKTQMQRPRQEEFANGAPSKVADYAFRQTVFEEVSKSGQKVRGKLLSVMDREKRVVLSFKTFVDKDGKDVSRIVKLEDYEIIYDIKRSRKVTVRSGSKDDQFLEWSELSPGSKNQLVMVKEAFEQLLRSIYPLSEQYNNTIDDYYARLDKRLETCRKLWWSRTDEPYFYYAGDDKILSESEKRKMIDDAIEMLDLLYKEKQIQPKTVRDILKQEKKLKKAIVRKEEKFEKSLRTATTALKSRIDYVVARTKKSIYQKQGRGATILIILPDKI